MVKKILLMILLVLVLFLGGGYAYLALRQPAQQPASNIQVSMAPDRIARGQYIFQQLADCDGCHSEHDYSRVAAPVVPSGRGRGNVMSAMVTGMPGTVVAPNITPDSATGIGSWTDGEKIRAIRDGVDNKGRALFPMMPYSNYRNMSDLDVESVVAYMNSLPPVRNPLPETKLDFPVNLMIKGVPQPADAVQPPNRSDPLKYGEYLIKIASCDGCHTPMEKGQPIPGKNYAGGEVFNTIHGTVVSANITPDMETGLGKWSEEFFLKKIYDFKEYAVSGPPPLPGPDAFTIMPWLPLAQLPPEDLKAMYAYLRTLTPVHNPVETHPGAPKKTQ